MTTTTDFTSPLFGMATNLAVALINTGSPLYTQKTPDELMRECFGAVRNADQPAEPEAPEVVLTPAVPVEDSVSGDFIICLEDGKKFKSLKRHLRSHYNLTPEQYRAKWSLPADYPMVAPNYSATRSQLAKDSGLGTKK